MKRITVFLSVMLLLCSCADDVFLEAERFADYGGWIREDQFYDIMGSSYLMAHGVGNTVEDASTDLTLPSSGSWNVWVRTYNWNSPWDSSQAPGIFQIMVDGVPLNDMVGDVPQKWDWQFAGTFQTNDKNVTVSLHDLTGFDGRCDALMFTKHSEPNFPKTRKSRTIVHRKKYDLIVAGGGMAGLSAGVSASRLGLSVLILQDRPVMGGNASVEIKVPVIGLICEEPYPSMGRVAAEYGENQPELTPARVDSLLKYEEGLEVRYSHRVIGAETCLDKISSIVAVDHMTGDRHVFNARYYADCTGDAALGYLSGAEYMQGQETKAEYDEDLAPETVEGLSYGSSLRWIAVNGENPVSFPLCPWAYQFDDQTAVPVMKNRWNWETGFYKDQIQDIEYIRDSWFRYVYGNWAYLKNSETFRDRYSCAYIRFMGNVLAKRESRRLKGDVVFTQNDILKEEWKRYDDPAVLCSYPVDQHLPVSEYRSIQKHGYNPPGPIEKIPGVTVNFPYMLPYRSLYSRNIDNLFMAGRDVSVTRVALASTRVMGSTAMMGEAVAIAASLCCKYRCTPRKLYQEYLDELLDAFREGTPARHETVFQDRPY
jgi:hypothetical protein